MHYIDDPFIAYITRCQIESFQAGHFFNHGCLFLVKENLNYHDVGTLKHNNINSRENLDPLQMYMHLGDIKFVELCLQCPLVDFTNALVDSLVDPMLALILTLNHTQVRKFVFISLIIKSS